MDQQLIPERDSGPKPKPRNRRQSLGANQKSSKQIKNNENDIDDVISLSSISSASSGVDNFGFSHDELPPEKVTSKTTPSSFLHNLNNNKKYISSDSDLDNNVPSQQVFTADVHMLPPNKDIIMTLKQKEDEMKIEKKYKSFLKIENEVEESKKLSLNKPKPKPRAKFLNDSDDPSLNISDETKSKSISNNNKNKANNNESPLLLSERQKMKMENVHEYLASTISPKKGKVKVKKVVHDSDSDDDEKSSAVVDDSDEIDKNYSKKNDEKMLMKPEKLKNDHAKTLKGKRIDQNKAPHSIINLFTSDHDENDDYDDDEVEENKIITIHEPPTILTTTKNKTKKPDTRIDIENLMESPSSSRPHSSFKENVHTPTMKKENFQLSPGKKNHSMEMQSFSKYQKLNTFTNREKKSKTKTHKNLHDEKPKDDNDSENSDIGEEETVFDKNSPFTTTTTVRSKIKSKDLIMRDEESEIERLKTNTNKRKGSSREDSPGQEDGKLKSKREQRRVGQEESFDKYIGVTIHCCDLLPMDPNIIHPVVKVTILNENGEPFTKHKVLLSGKTDHHHHHHSSSSPSQPTTTTRRGHKTKVEKDLIRSNSKDEGTTTTTTKRDQMFRSKNKILKSTSSFRNQKDHNVSRLHSDSVLPIMTQPCKLSYYLPTFAPQWNELLLIEEPFQDFLHPDAETVLFFEVMDFLPIQESYSNQSKHRLFSSYHGSEAGWYKIAWGFLKLVGPNGLKNINRKIRLQLFKPEPLPSKYSKEGIEVYGWWRSSTRTKINSTLYVTVKAVRPPTKTVASLRTLLTMRKDHLAQAIIESQLKTTQSPKKRHKNSEIITRKPGKMDLTIDIPTWTRLEGQKCKVPNKIYKNLPISQIESLNLTISGNVQCVKFTSCGLKLAAGLDTDELHTILIFEIPSGKLLYSIRCHHGLIYDLDWKTFGDKKFLLPDKYYLASASADTTATVWEIRPTNDSPKLIKKLLHTSFVYTVRMHPTRSNIVATGCFDYIIRIWDIEKVSSSRANSHSETESIPIIQLDRHESFVNSFVFDNSGNHLYSGDGSGAVFEWTTRAPLKKRKSWTVEREITFRESGKNPINSLALHPSGNRLLVHMRNNCIKILDLATFLVLHSFSGLVNEKLQVQSCFSPCGNLVLSGSEDSTLCIWDADSGAIVQFITPENHKNCAVTSVDYHPYDHYVAIGLSSAISEPCPILLYTYKSQSKTNNIPKFSTIAKVTTAFRSSHPNLTNDFSTTALENNDDYNIKKGEEEFSTVASSRVQHGDSIEKFTMIVKKLDSALKLTRRPTTGKRMTDPSSSIPTSTPMVEKSINYTNGNENDRSLLVPESETLNITDDYDNDNDLDEKNGENLNATMTEIEKGGWRKSKGKTFSKLNTKSEIITMDSKQELYNKTDDRDRKIQVNMKHHRRERKTISNNGLSQQQQSALKIVMSGPSKNLGGDFSHKRDELNNNNYSKVDDESVQTLSEELPEKEFPAKNPLEKISHGRQKRRERMRQIYNESSDVID